MKFYLRLILHKRAIIGCFSYLFIFFCTFIHAAHSETIITPEASASASLELGIPGRALRMPISLRNRNLHVGECGVRPALLDANNISFICSGCSQNTVRKNRSLEAQLRKTLGECLKILHYAPDSEDIRANNVRTQCMNLMNPTSTASSSQNLIQGGNSLGLKFGDLDVLLNIVQNSYAMDGFVFTEAYINGKNFQRCPSINTNSGEFDLSAQDISINIVESSTNTENIFVEFLNEDGDILGYSGNDKFNSDLPTTSVTGGVEQSSQRQQHPCSTYLEINNNNFNQNTRNLSENTLNLQSLRRSVCSVVKDFENRQVLRPLHKSDLERMLLLINDMPWVESAIGSPRVKSNNGIESTQQNINPDEKLMELHITVRLKDYEEGVWDSNRISGVIFGDTRQSPLIGPGLMGVTLRYDGLYSPSDSLEVSYLNTFGDEDSDYSERQTARARYSTRVTGSGLRIGGEAQYVRSSPGENLAPLIVESNQFSGKLFADYPFMRSSQNSIWVGADLQLSEGVTEAVGGAVTISDDSVRSIGVSARGVHPDISWGRNTSSIDWSAEARFGLNILSASQFGDQNLSRFDAQPDFSLVRGGVRIQQPLEFLDSEGDPGAFSLKFNLRGQYAFSPLFGSEEFSIGGQEFGRAYDPGEASGDHGYGFSFEFGYMRPLRGIQLQGEDDILIGGYSFYDQGAVYNIGGGSPVSETLSSFGVGARFHPTRKSRIEIEAAFPNQRLRRTSQREPRFSLTFQYEF